MQQNLFGEIFKNAPKTLSFGAKSKQEYSREAKYQVVKAEMDSLQKEWTNGAQKRAEALAEAQRRHALLCRESPKTIVLVACVSLKADAACAAQDLYISDWFLKARKYAEMKGDDWYILSALSGLVEPMQEIQPYNYTLNKARRPERSAWAARVYSSLVNRVPSGSKIIILAGENYRQELIPLLENKFTVEVPMKGLGIGQQLAFLKKEIS